MNSRFCISLFLWSVMDKDPDIVDNPELQSLLHPDHRDVEEDPAAVLNSLKTEQLLDRLTGLKGQLRSLFEVWVKKNKKQNLTLNTKAYKVLIYSLPYF